MSSNDLARAAFWMNFIVERGAFPAPGLLRAQFDAAEITEFCPCHCNSFGMRVRDGAAMPITAPAARREPGHHAVHSVDFTLEDGRSLEIIVFANSDGHVDFIEVDCCANSFPVPEDIQIKGGPTRIESWSLLTSDEQR